MYLKGEGGGGGGWGGGSKSKTVMTSIVSPVTVFRKRVILSPSGSGRVSHFHGPPEKGYAEISSRIKGRLLTITIFRHNNMIFSLTLEMLSLILPSSQI